MGTKIDAYEFAKPRLAAVADGRERLKIVALDGKNPGFIAHRRRPDYAGANDTWDRQPLDVAKGVMAEVVKLLEPAVHSLFQSLLADKLEAMRLEAIAEAEAEQARDAQRNAKQLRELRGEPEPTPGEHEGDPCNRDACPGTMVVKPAGDCSCHLNPPCPACENAFLACDKCGFEVK